MYIHSDTYILAFGPIGWPRLVGRLTI